MVSQTSPVSQAASDDADVVAIVEDERISRRALGLLLSGRGYRTQAYATAEEALQAMQSGHMPRVALVDLDLPGISGLELISRLQAMNPGVRTILITATDQDTLQRRLNGRPVPYLRKPLNFGHLIALLEGSPSLPGRG